MIYWMSSTVMVCLHQISRVSGCQDISLRPEPGLAWPNPWNVNALHVLHINAGAKWKDFLDLCCAVSLARISSTCISGRPDARFIVLLLPLMT